MRSELLLAAALILPGCAGSDEPVLLAEGLAAGLLCVRAPAADDVWIAGAAPSASEGPMLLHYDGAEWSTLDTQSWAGSELWWMQPLGEQVLAAGHDGLLLQGPRSGPLEAVDGPDPQTTFFGVWGASADDVWVVGTVRGETPRATAWRRLDGVWSEVDLSGVQTGDALFKVHGLAVDDVWLVGSQGTALHWDGSSLTATDTGHPTAPLLTVDASSDAVLAVGGTGEALLLEWSEGAWTDVTPDFQPPYNGVCSGADTAWAVGRTGARAQRVDGTWTPDLDRDVQPLIRDDWHGCAVDPHGGLWTVGGRIASRPLQDGVIAYQGPDAPASLP